MDLKERSDPLARRHPWETVRAEFLIALAMEQRRRHSVESWLDIGSGDAWLAQSLREMVGDNDRITCWDINYGPDLLENPPPRIELTASQPQETYDAVLLFDVLEHVEDDVGFLGDIISSNLSLAGIAIVSVPAHQWLYTSHDTHLAHYRRYSRRQCRSVLEQSGLAIHRDGGLFASLLPVRAIQTGVDRLRSIPSNDKGIGEWKGGKTQTAAIERILTFDSRIGAWASKRGRYVPGLSYWAVCTRTS